MRKIPNYQSDYRIVALSKSHRTTMLLCEKGLNVLAVYEDGAFINGEKIKDSNAILLSQFEKDQEYDVFEITKEGNCIKLYDTTSLDNAIIVTNACNSNCIMCPTPEIIRKDGKTLPYDALANIIRHFPSDACHLTITGGEPFLMGRRLFDFFRILKEKFIDTEFLLLTNGRIFAVEDYVALLKETLPNNTIIGIPFHGYNPQTHDMVTQSPGSFRQTFFGVKRLLKQGFRIEVRIVVSLLTINYLDEIAKMIIEEFPTVYSVKIMGLEMLGNAAKNKDKVWVSYEVAFNKAQEAINNLIYAGIDTGLYNFPLCSVKKEYWGIYCKSISDNKVRFAEKCTECTVRDACGGLFAGSSRMASKDVKPFIKNGNDEN